MSLGDLAFLTTEVPASNETTGKRVHGVNGTTTVDNNEIEYTFTNVGVNRIEYLYTEMPVNVGDVYFMGIDVLPKHNVVIYGEIGRDTGNDHFLYGGDWGRFSDVRRPNNTHHTRFYLGSLTDYEIGDVIKFKNPMVINLTQVFGVGNEPTAEQMDRLLKQFPNSWFDGTVNLFNAKEFINIYNREIQEIREAILSLGGE